MTDSRYSLLYHDYDGEPSVFAVNGDTIDETNLVAEEAKMDALRAALDAVSDGLVIKETKTFSVEQEAASNGKATSEFAQREAKWLVRGHDATDYSPWRVEIPCPDLTLLDVNDRKQMDKSNAAYTALKAAIEAFVVNARQHSVVVDEIIHIGKNS